MALTLDYMRAKVRNRLDDTDFEQTYLDTALNQAQRDIVNGRTFTFLEKRSTITLLSGTKSVALPTDLRGTPIEVKVEATGVPSYSITDGFLDYATYHDSYPQAGAPTAPFAWTVFAGNMVFPSNADKDYTLTLSYIRVSPYVDGSTVTTFDIPDEFEELLMIGAYMRIAKREDDYDVSQNELLDYQKQLTELTRVYSRNRGPRRIHVMRVPNRR